MNAKLGALSIKETIVFTHLRIKNFRSISDSGNLPLSNLNIIVGPNNSGKSSLLYAILLLRQTMLDKDRNTTLVTSGEHLDLGSYFDLVRGNEPDGVFSIGFGFEARSKTFQELRFAIPGEEGEMPRDPLVDYSLTFAFDRESNRIVVRNFAVSDKAHRFGLTGRQDESGRWNLSGLPKEVKQHAKLAFHHFVPLIPLPDKDPRADERTLGLLFWYALYTGSQMPALTSVFENTLYVGPVRQRIPRYGILGTQAYSELGPSGENLMRVLSRPLPKGKRRRGLIDDLNYWLDKKFRVLRNIRIQNIDREGTVKSLVADDPQGEANINLAAMGSGISQLVPVVVQTALTPRHGCTVIEQPEIHLHPAAQASLGDLFVKYAKASRQLIVETHSEHLLLRVRRRIAEGKLSPEKVRVFFVDKNRRTHQTRIRCLPIRSNGHFTKWPAGFFEEGYKEAMAIAMAQQKAGK